MGLIEISTDEYFISGRVMDGLGNTCAIMEEVVVNVLGFDLDITEMVIKNKRLCEKIEQMLINKSRSLRGVETVAQEGEV